MNTLPLGFEPLRLADGTIIGADGGVIKRQDDVIVEVPNTQELQRLHVEAKKRLADLPVPVGKMNLISLILTYSLFGVRDDEIGHAVGLSPDQVTQVKESQFYVDIQKEVRENILKADAETIRGVFVRAATKAAGRIEELVNSDDEAVALSASKDMLDRAGHRPVDVHEHKHSVQGGLKIEYVDRKHDNIPTIDVRVDGEF